MNKSNMEHIKITQLGGGFVRLTPEAGYLIEHIPSHRIYSVVEDKEDNIHDYVAVRKDNY